MKTADVFNVQTNVVLAFTSDNKDYKMHLLIENGLLILGEVKGDTVLNQRILFLGDHEAYTGEKTETTEISTEVSPATEKKPKKRKSKKKK